MFSLASLSRFFVSVALVCTDSLTDTDEETTCTVVRLSSGMGTPITSMMEPFLLARLFCARRFSFACRSRARRLRSRSCSSMSCFSFSCRARSFFSASRRSSTCFFSSSRCSRCLCSSRSFSSILFFSSVVASFASRSARRLSASRRVSSSCACVFCASWRTVSDNSSFALSSASRLRLSSPMRCMFSSIAIRRCSSRWFSAMRCRSSASALTRNLVLRRSTRRSLRASMIDSFRSRSCCLLLTFSMCLSSCSLSASVRAVALMSASSVVIVK
eukprot:Mycagemm_TRINITY_DN10140_c0_g2::TRINITY_DN10140_c0_g2_i1::g.5056::m.5056 type:complete len:273 gc:universal TRINITY_DN10140_c0_g2_i1:256-1074(+)